MVPIAIESASIMGIDPIIPVMGVAMSAIIAFITPVGAPSTAMIYGTGKIDKGELIKNGVFFGSIMIVTIIFVIFILPAP